MSKQERRAEIERALIGCMVFDDTKIDDFIAHGGDEAWFSVPQCREVANLIFGLHAEGKPIDVLMLGQAGNVDAVWLEGCVDLMGTPTRVGHYTYLLAGHESLSRFGLLAGAMKAKAERATPDMVDDVFQWASDKLLDAKVGRFEQTKTSEEHVDDWVQEIQNPEAATMLDWPVSSINYKIGRVKRQLIWICALPSLGKTSFGVQWGTMLAKGGTPNSYASLESDHASIAQIQIAQLGEVNTFTVDQGHAKPEDFKRIQEAKLRIPKDMRIIENGRTTHELMAWGKQEAKAGSKLLQVDNTRSITGNSNMNRIDKMAMISAKMKELRDKTGLPVVVYHHSRVDTNGREDASWSSDIRKDADLLIFLRENEEMSRNFSGPNGRAVRCIDFYVDKNRNGRAGVSVPMDFRQEIRTFLPFDEH